MRIRERDTLDFLEADLLDIAKKAPGEFRGVLREGLKVGNSLAKQYAKDTSGRHAKRYPATFTTSMNRGFSGFGTFVYQGEYGPERRGQGGLAPVLERGGRFSKPHLNLFRSADQVAPALQRETGDAVDRLFRDFAGHQRALF